MTVIIRRLSTKYNNPTGINDKHNKRRQNQRNGKNQFDKKLLMKVSALI